MGLSLELGSKSALIRHPGRDHGRDGRRGSLGRAVEAGHRERLVRGGPQRQRRPGNHSQGAFAAHDQLGQVIASDALDCTPARAQQLAVGEHDLQTEYIIGGHAIFHTAQPAGVGRQVAADRTEFRARRIRRVIQPVAGDSPGQLRVEHPGLGHDEPVGHVDLEYPISSLDVEQDAAVDRARSAGEPTAGTLRHHRTLYADAVRRVCWT